MDYLGSVGFVDEGDMQVTRNRSVNKECVDFECIKRQPEGKLTNGSNLRFQVPGPVQLFLPNATPVATRAEKPLYPSGLGGVFHYRHL